jgi:hypothetical protein
MDDQIHPVQVTLRIPGAWEHPGQLIEGLSSGYRLTPESLVLPNGNKLDFTPMPPDDQFADVFATACRGPASSGESETVRRYTVNVCLSGSGGSLESALAMMQAGSAIVRAGGAGVFVDNSAIAHGGTSWIEMTDDGGPDALSFAYVSIVQGKKEVSTMGMHVLGLPEVVMTRADADANDMSIIEVIRYLSSSNRRIDDGHILADELGPRFTAHRAEDNSCGPESPMHNPWGRLRLVSIKDIAERN